MTPKVILLGTVLVLIAMSEARDIRIARSVLASEGLADGSADVTADAFYSPSLKPNIRSMNVISNVKSRYSTTVVSSRVANPANFSQEVVFSVIIPDAAFISEFLMEIEGKVYKASVKEKEVAKQEYQRAVSQGVAAATVAVSARDSNRFTVNVNVEPLSKATFNLTYEELLIRDLDVYNLKVNLHPGQIVDDLSVDVFIDELKPIKVLRTPKMSEGNDIPADESTESNSFAQIEFTNEQKTSAHVKFSPTKIQQKEIAKMLKNSDDIMSGQFVVQYDVTRDPQGGEVIIYDGYFVHFFAPEDLEPLNKHVIFVLDVSGSMSWGNKINQLKQAMNTILSDLKPGDYFSVIEFSSRVKVWNLENTDGRAQSYGDYVFIDDNNIELLPKAYAANTDKIRKAKELVNYMNAGGGTNIYDALKIALKICKKGIEFNQTAVVEGSDQQSIPNVEPMIVFLTDGDPTVGNTNLQSIQIMVSEENSNENTDKLAALYTLAFGEDADRNFLKKLSLKNAGFMRHIYEAADAANQLQHFYKQISSPLLKNVKFVYPTDQIEEETVTKHQFRNLFSGSELVVAGKLSQQQEPLTFSEEPVISNCFGEIKRFRPLILPIPKETHKGPSLERLWAYLTIKQLLDQKEVEIDPQAGPVISTGTETPLTAESADKKNVTDPKKRALELALKYQFVTSLTSLVVVKPNATSSVDTESASTSRSPSAFPGSGSYSGASPKDAFLATPHSYSGSHFGMPRPLYSPVPAASPVPFRSGGAFGGHRGPPSFSSAGSYQSGHHGPPSFSSAGSYQSVSLDNVQQRIPIDQPIDLSVTTPLIKKVAQDVDSSSSESDEQDVDLDQLGVGSLTWLKNITVVPDSIRLPSGVYKLGANSTITVFATCGETTNANGNPGACVFLSYCPGAFPALTDLTTYTKYFCDVHGYAGICCDDQQRKKI